MVNINQFQFDSTSFINEVVEMLQTQINKTPDLNPLQVLKQIINAYQDLQTILEQHEEEIYSISSISNKMLQFLHKISSLGNGLLEPPQ